MCSAATTSCRWPTRAGSTSSTTPSRRRRRLEASVCLLKAHGTLVKAGVHGPTVVGVDAAVLQGDQLGRLERVRASKRSTACASTASHHYLDLASSGRVDLSDMLTHTFALDDWRAAFTALATQDESGRDQDRVRPAFVTTTAVHPLDMVTARRDRRSRRDHPRRPALRGRVGVRARAAVRTGEGRRSPPSRRVDREIEVLLVPPGARLEAIEVVVSVTSARRPLVARARRACGPRCSSASRCRRSSA